MMYCHLLLLGAPAPPPPPPLGGPGISKPPSSAVGGPPPPPSRENKPPPVVNERGDLLASIRAGFSLKKVDQQVRMYMVALTLKLTIYNSIILLHVSITWFV